MKAFLYSCITSIAVLITACSTPDKQTVPSIVYAELSEEEKHLAQNAQYSFTVAPGLEVTQFASEPMMINPTNMDIDARGRVWICEARNYRLPFNPAHKARKDGDRILILEDTNQDGQADTAKVFYQGNDINAALGIAVLGDRIIVSASPNVLVFYDEDQDDIPERKDTLFSSIKGIDDDHGIHAFIFGPDGRLYFNFGNAGSQIRDKHGAPLKDRFGRTIQADGQPYRQGMAFRCQPDGSELEVLGYNFRNIYELCLDSYGNIFQSDNDDDGNKSVRINYVMEYGNYGYQDQITGAGWRERRVGMHEEIPFRHWHQNDPGVIPNMLLTGAGSPAGITFYEGSYLPEIFHEQIIHAEPGHQVVRAYITEKSGEGYQAKIENILQSEDKWFRPSDVCIAPDGSLFVSDWHDAVVGGNGMDDIERGRIYRITPAGKANQYNIPLLDLESLDGAAQALKSSNQATRYLAWNKLHEAGLDAEPALLKIIEEDNPASTVRSMWLLAHMPQKGFEYATRLLNSPLEDLRIAGIRMLRYLHSDQLITELKKISRDVSPQVRREIAVALTGRCDSAAIAIWLDLVDQLDPSDRWALESLGLSTDHCPEMYFKAWMRHVQNDWNTPVGRSLIWRVRSIEALPLLVHIIEDKNTPRSELPRYFRSFHFIDAPNKDHLLAGILSHFPADTLILKSVLLSINPGYLKSNSPFRGQVTSQLPVIKGSPEWFFVIRTLKLTSQNEILWTMIMDEIDDEKRRSAASTLLNLAGIDYLKNKLGTINAVDYEKCIALFANNANYEMATFLASELSRRDLDYSVKRRIVDALGNSGSGQEVLYQLIKAEKIQEDLKLPVAVKLLNSWNSKIRNEAPSMLASIPGANLGQEPDIFTISRKTGDAKKGKSVFQSSCANCHQVDGIGIRFGPDLTEIGDKLSARGLYQAILYPSAGVSFGYEGVNLTLHNGQVYQGYFESKTDDEVLLRTQSGESVSIRNVDIKSREDLRQSLMTEGLHRTFSQQDLIDLVTYLQTLSKQAAI